MNIKLLPIALILFSSGAFAEYQIKMNLPDVNSKSFTVPGEETPTEPTDPEVPADVCPTSFAPISYASGFPQVRQNGALYYDVQITSAGGYASISDFSSGQRFYKMVSTTISGVPFGNGGLYAGTTQTWSVSPGQYLNVVLTPIAIDMNDGSTCASGTPITLVNKTYAQLLP